MKTTDEIEAEMDKACDTRIKNKGRSLWAGMSYEQGVEDALRWALDDDECEAPMAEAE